MNTSANSDRPMVFYDGGCPLCRREIAHYRHLDRHGRLCWVDICAQPDVLAHYGITWKSAMQRLHVRDVDGRMLTGAYAFAALWQRLPYYRWLATLVSLPGMLLLLDKAYSGFAHWRWKRRCDAMCRIDRDQTLETSPTHTKSRVDDRL